MKITVQISLWKALLFPLGEVPGIRIAGLEYMYVKIYFKKQQGCVDPQPNN